MNKVYIVANWKLNPINSEEANWLLQAVGSEIASTKDLGKSLEVVLCAPFVYLSKLNTAKYKLRLGAQDCFWEDEGAYTGEISPHMLKELGCSYVIVGHSERKNYFGESFEMINKKVIAALAADITPVVCIGEKEQGNNTQELELQIKSVLQDISAEGVKNLMLVYEPEWAISSHANSKPATPENCKGSIEQIKKVAQELFGEVEIPVLYGGSTNSKNIAEFMYAGASGALVGSASLNAEEFIQLVKNAAP